MSNTNNPVFQEAANKYKYNYPNVREQLNQYEPYSSPTGNFTANGAINKTLVGLLMVFVVSALAFVFIPVNLISPVAIGAALVSIFVAYMIAKKTEITITHVAIYSIIEGLFVGGISKMFEMMYPGIVGTAIIATIVAAIVMMIFHKFSGFRMSNKVRKFISIATVSLGAVYLINLLLTIFGVNTGIIETGPNAGILSIVVSGIAIFLAVANLLRDYDDIEMLENVGAPQKEEWRAAFGLMVTLVWMYIEIIRILSYFRR